MIWMSFWIYNASALATSLNVFESIWCYRSSHLHIWMHVSRVQFTLVSRIKLTFYLKISRIFGLQDWISQWHEWIRFTLFGGLFEEAIESGLPAIQTQHPGFYYQQSAAHAMLRKKATVEDYASLDQSVTCPMPYKNPANLEFYGQRHWRPNRLSLEPADMKAELEGLAGLLHRDIMEVDLTVSHVCFVFFSYRIFLLLEIYTESPLPYQLSRRCDAASFCIITIIFL